MRRYATIASVSKRPEFASDTSDGLSRLMEDTRHWIQRAARMGADLVAFPECCPQLKCGAYCRNAELEHHGTLDRVRELAKEHKLYVVWPRLERAPGDRVYNASVLVGRKGEIVGRYHKMFPTISEMTDGVTPGDSCPVFETDFGRVALIICFDMNFPEIRDSLRAKRPDLLVFSSMYRGGQELHQWAIDLGCHVVSSIAAELGRIIDPGGKLLQMSTYEALAIQRVNFNRRQLHMDNNWDKMDSMLAKYGRDLTFEYYTQEARYVIGYEKPDRDVDEIIREFKLEHIQDYFNRSRQARAESLKKVAG